MKESVPVTADKENLARLRFQRFFRQYPTMARHDRYRVGRGRRELWQIYRRAVVRIPTSKPCIRNTCRLCMIDTMDQKWDAVVERVSS